MPPSSKFRTVNQNPHLVHIFFSSSFNSVNVKSRSPSSTSSCTMISSQKSSNVSSSSLISGIPFHVSSFSLSLLHSFSSMFLNYFSTSQSINNNNKKITFMISR
eukprot:TRINITY_DN2400_c0_g2_i4.p3 TRINITY_DN2400_c0_g2~~TRINITY_DN2400_c0_g2_i4.p3  ORF type:complete len:104 (+),score=25.27 TRINITY_DN2400_c0_g2_i4:851-1162(+)